MLRDVYNIQVEMSQHSACPVHRRLLPFNFLYRLSKHVQSYVALVFVPAVDASEASCWVFNY